jgi:hypothetical protein
MTDDERKDWEQKLSMVEDVIGAFADGKSCPFEALPKGVRDKLGILSRKGRKEAK